MRENVEMTTEKMIEELYSIAKLHKNDIVGVGELNIHTMCVDVAERLQELLQILKKNTVKMIPCSLAMPKCSDDLLLIQCSGKPAKNIIFEDAIVMASYTKEGWILEGYTEWDNPIVVAWSELPEPYETEKEYYRQQSASD